MRALWNRGAALRSTRVWSRVLGLLVLLAVTAAVLFVLGWVMGFPAGYNAAQKASAPVLARMDTARVLALLDGTTTDLAFYIPAYLVVAFLAVMATSRTDPGTRWQHVFAGGIWSDGVALTAAALLGLADVVETLCFRWALEDVQQGHGPGGLVWMTDVASVAYWVKWGFALLLLLLIVVRVLRPAQPAPPPPPVPAPLPAEPVAV
jgi:hypothetical protein